MNDASLPTPPEWVAKRDGQLVPFDPDKISRSLFAAGEAQGHGDAFLARELTDSVIHFLAAEVEGAVPTTAQVAEIVIKIVRELGHPALALAYGHYAADEHSALPAPSSLKPSPHSVPASAPLHAGNALSFAQALRNCGRQFALQAIFTRDLLALQADGLIDLGALERPADLAAVLLQLHKGADQEEALFVLLENAKSCGTNLVVLDGPEHLLAPPWPAPKPSAPAFARRLHHALGLSAMRAVANLNAAELPPWTEDTTGSPLFHSARAQVVGLRNEQADHLARVWSSLSDCAVRIDWHLCDRDFAAKSPAQERLLLRLQEALRGANLTFVFDRPQLPAALAEGMTRRRPALLLHVRLNLPRLLEWTATAKDPEKFLEKLGSLTRMALSAGSQKREFLRNLARVSRAAGQSGSDPTRGFLLDRAGLVVVPIGLDHVVQTMTGHSMTQGASSLELARRILQRLRDDLRASGRGGYPETCLDGTTDSDELSPSSAQAAGLTPWDPSAALANQLQSASALHAVADSGTLLVMLPDQQQPTPAELLAVLSFAWEKTDIIRLRFLRSTATQPSLPFHE